MGEEFILYAFEETDLYGEESLHMNANKFYSFNIAGDVLELSLLEDEDVENIKLSGIIDTEFKESGGNSGKFSGDGNGYYNSIPTSMTSWFSGEVEYAE